RMKKSLLLLLFCIGCSQAPTNAPVSVSQPTQIPDPTAPTTDNPAYYEGYAVISKFDEVTHTFQAIGQDSVPAQIRAGVADGEIKATVSVNDESRPYNVFLFCKGGYYLGNDKTSYAYFSKDYKTLVWGSPTPGDPTLFKTIYANR
ncbi:MAG: hypothetical protein ABI778_11660, partial [Ignavibacteriota bacterium]